MTGMSKDASPAGIAPPLIVIGIATFRRNEMLERCLESLQAIALPEATIRIAIVDNSSNRMAERVCAKWGTQSAFPIDYLSETRQGISEARNALLEHALNANADLLAFIDDDETADPGWLRGLYQTMEAENADVVQGAVRYVPEGAKISNECRVTKRPERSRVKSVAAGNVMFKLSLCREADLRFDRRFSLTGGEDYDFFLRCALAGANMVWTNTAIVSEVVPPYRQTEAYRLKRLFRTRASGAFADRLRLGFRTVPRHLGKGLRGLLQGLGSLVLLPFSLALGVTVFRKRALRTAEHFYKGAGRLVGLLGHGLRMYR